MGRGAVKSAVSVQLFEQTKPISPKRCVLSGLWRIFRSADGFRVFEARWVEIGFRFEFLLKTKDRIGFAS
jgi:hypothetical protein